MSNGWNQWSKHVLGELEKFDKRYNEGMARLRKIDTELAVIKTKISGQARLWGVLGGAFPAVGVILLYVVKELLSK